MFVTAAYSPLPSLTPILIWGLVVCLVIPALLIFCNSAMKIHAIVAKKIQYITKMHRDDATAVGLARAADAAAIKMQARCRGFICRHNYAELVPPAKLMGRRIYVDGYGHGTVTEFKKGCFFGIGPSKHTVDFDGHPVQLKLRRHGNGGEPFVLLHTPPPSQKL